MAYGKGRGKPADIQARVIKVFDEQGIEYDRGGGSDLRIIAWIVNGSEKSPQLERRDWWRGEDGEKKTGKAKGLSVGDFQFILENAQEIGEYMGVSKKIVEQALSQSANYDKMPAGVTPSKEQSSGGGPDPW